MRCDLHVHTLHSGMCNVPALQRICRESYNDPRHLYETLKRRGMDLVTVTDHDSIDAVESLRRHSDFFLSEEVTCRATSSTELHVGVYGISERDHVEMQRRRGDVLHLAAYLDERRLLFSVNHVFSGLTGRRVAADFEEFAEIFPAVETRNGQMAASANRHAAAFASRTRKAEVGGSDAHTLDGAGRTFTEVAGARGPEEFLEGLKRGHGIVMGESGSYWKLTRAVWDIGRELTRERRWTWLLAPLFAAVPAVTLINLGLEAVFAYKWGRRAGRMMQGRLPAGCALGRVS